LPFGAQPREENHVNSEISDGLSRHASAISRRGSLLSLGAACIATLARSITGAAKNKSRKSNRKKCKNKASQQETDRCPEQVQPCTTFLDAFCGGRPECLDHSACCAFLESCESTTFLTCLVNQA
jgi:hypothetical protein